MVAPGDAVMEWARRSGIARGELVGLAVAPGVAVGMASAGGTLVVPGGVAASEVLRRLEESLQPRWVTWSNQTIRELERSGLRVAICWDLAAVHRVLCGGWEAGPARVWAAVRQLPFEDRPSDRPPDLFSHSNLDAGDQDQPRRPDGYLRPEWTGGGWAASGERVGKWAELAREVAAHQQTQLGRLPACPRALAVARSESAAELLSVELAADGLPVDRAAAEHILAELIGPRPASEAEAATWRERRDREVLARVPTGVDVDLRSPGQVKALLGHLGVELPDTRAWRLRSVRDAHPVVPALLAWRKAERVATTYGYGWLDAHLGADGRLRGAWTACDGAAGRMTASAGLHNMPAELRPAVVAEPGHVFVRADLGQIEPRVLAAVSGDRALVRATGAEDLYLPVAQQLGVDRATAKVAVLGAMYGQTTGHGADALRSLRAAYPTAVGYLETADRTARAGGDLRTYGGRRISVGAPEPGGDTRARTAARGRFGRNAVIQGAAAELFKMWAVTVRTRAAPLGAQIVLCLHDELLVQAPVAHGAELADLLGHCLVEAAGRWSPEPSVRFVADISVISRWSDAKPADS